VPGASRQRCFVLFQARLSGRAVGRFFDFE
jgi:hypothetical protein